MAKRWRFNAAELQGARGSVLLERLQPPAGVVQPPAVALENALDSLWPRVCGEAGETSAEAACTASNGVIIRCDPSLHHVN